MNGELLNRITIVPGLMSGRPTIRNQRFRVMDVIEMLESGMTNEQILEEHPILEPLDIEACLLYAKDNDIYKQYFEGV